MNINSNGVNQDELIERIKTTKENKMELWTKELKDFRAYHWYDWFIYSSIPIATKLKFAELRKNFGHLEAL